ncbi:MAG: hypothetical protein PHR28_01305 [candidate division Zixibacteria bacterium]|nr:hypothetical protein [candidate division Zixibacteria bacterium]
MMAILLLVNVSHTQTATPANDYCPVLTDQRVDSTIFVEYQGKRVYFCCTKCRRDFLANPSAYLANLPQFAVASSTADVSSGMPTDTGALEQTRDSADQVPTRGGVKTSKVIRLAGKLHPVVVHFPIALVITATFFSLRAIMQKKQSYDHISYRLMYLAALSGVVTVLFGLAAGAGSSWPALLAGYFSWHRFFGLTAGTWTILSATAGFVAERGGSIRLRRLYHAMLFINVVIIGITGHLGATLVYDPDYFKL